MTDFGHLKKYDVSENKAVYSLYQIAGDVKLHVLHAGETNVPYFNEVLRRQAKNARIVSAGRLNQQFLAANRNEDRELFAKHILVGWENVCDTSGTEVPFSCENARDFLNALPDWIFDEVRTFAANATNFMGTALQGAGDPEGNL